MSKFDYRISRAFQENAGEDDERDDPLDKLFQNLTLNPDEIEELPEEYLVLYKQRLEERRKLKFGRENLLLQNIRKKLQARKQLDYSEEDLLDQRTLKVSTIVSPQVDVNAVDMLNDIVNGDYTLQDVHSVREGVEAADDKDAVENSPLQLLDAVIDSVKEQTHEALQTKQPGHFFGSLESELTGKMKPSQIDDAINHAATAINLVQGTYFVDNDAQEALNDYIKALAMNEAEMKLKQIDEMANETQARQEATENLAEVAAAAGVLSDAANPIAQPTIEDCSIKNLSFDVTELNYDVSFLPSNDPNVYKPLEIISYIGMTKNAS